MAFLPEEHKFNKSSCYEIARNMSVKIITALDIFYFKENDLRRINTNWL